MKHRIWLEDWERELVRLALIEVSERARGALNTEKLPPAACFSCRWTMRQLTAVSDKFAVRNEK